MAEADVDVEAAEAEREFCLRSLRDLDDEHAAGDLDDADYLELRDAYVARAAAALRALDGAAAGDPPAASTAGFVGDADFVDARRPRTSPGVHKAENAHKAEVAIGPPAGPRSRPRVLVSLVAAALVVGGTGWAVLASASSRSPGQEITGQALAPEVEAQTLQSAAAAEGKGDTVTALKDYQKVLKTDPNQPEALTGEGWILAQTGQPAYLQQGLGMLARAEAISPAYPPAHLYRGVALLSEDDYADAIPELKWYLAHSPDPSLVTQVRKALAGAEAKSKAAG